MRKRYYKHKYNDFRYLKILCTIRSIKNKKIYLVELNQDNKFFDVPKCEEYKCPAYKKCFYDDYRACYSRDLLSGFINQYQKWNIY